MCGEPVGSSDVNSHKIRAPIFANAVAIVDFVKYLLVPTNSAKELRSKFVFRFDIISECVRVTHGRDLKTSFVKLRPQLQVMPCEADVLSQNKFAVVPDIPARRQGRLCFTSEIRALAAREAEIPSFVRPESDPAAESRIFKTIFGNIPGFGTGGE